MKSFIVSFVASLVSMGILDAVWLSTMFRPLYLKNIGTMFRETPLFTPAVLFYLIYGIGVTLLVVLPSVAGQWTLLKTFGYGALLGFVAYATYDLTNQATLREWATIVTVVDLLWGAFLTGVAATAGRYAIQIFVK